MSLIEQATKRLDELSRAGIVLPWSSAGPESEAARGVEGDSFASPSNDPAGTIPPATARRLEHLRVAAGSTEAQAAAAPLREARRSAEVQLDFARLNAAGYLVPGRPRSALADQFRQIKRSVLKNLQPASQPSPKRANLIMVTSALKGEGKTFCAVNLAMSIAAELDHSVLLVDADVVRPAVFDRLGLPAAEGLLDVLTDAQRDLSTVMLRTNVPKLSLLSAGAARLNSTELLTSEAMERLLDDLATTYADRVVILDAPPLLPTTESHALATRVGQILMVVEAFSTSPSAVAQAFEAVEQCPVVMSILNKCETSSAAYGYGYYD